MKIEKAGPLRGSRELLAHIRANFRSLPEFAEAKGLDRIKLQLAIRGDLQRVDVDFAFAVQNATDGEVKAEWWVNSPKNKRRAA